MAAYELQGWTLMIYLRLWLVARRIPECQNGVRPIFPCLFQNDLNVGKRVPPSRSIVRCNSGSSRRSVAGATGPSFPHIPVGPNVIVRSPVAAKISTRPDRTRNERTGLMPQRAWPCSNQAIISVLVLRSRPSSESRVTLIQEALTNSGQEVGRELLGKMTLACNSLGK